MIIINDWQVEPDRCILDNKKDSIKISARSMDVLVYLAERQGQVVSADELIETFWGSPATTDHAVHKLMASLRRALQDSAQEPRYIKTLPKRGYMLIADVRFPDRADANQPTLPDAPAKTAIGRWRSAIPPARWGVLTVVLTLGLIATALLRFERAPQSTVSKLAILPPANLAELDTVERHRLEELLNTLSTQVAGLPEVDVLSTKLLGTSPDAAAVRAQGARLALTTEVHSSEDSMRFFVSLVRLEDGVNLYAEEFALGDSQARSESLAGDIVAALGVYLDQDEYDEMLKWGARHPRAYAHFRKARFYNDQYNHRDWKLAIAHYRKAIERDPAFVNAYLGAAKTAHHMAIYSREARVEELVEQVLELSRQLAIAVPDSPALQTLKAVRMRMEGHNHFQQERSYREEILSGSATGQVYASYALFLIGARLYDEAERFLELARSNQVAAITLNEAWNFRTQILPPQELAEVKSVQLLDHPSHIGILGTAVSSFVYLGDLERAESYYRRQRELDEDGVRAHLSRALLAVASGTINANSFQAVHKNGGAFQLASRDYGELLHPSRLGDPDLNFNNGVLSFMLGALETGATYWRQLTRIDERKLVTRLHALEIFFPKHILQHPAYSALLEELDVGLSWQRQLMEGVMEMSPVTGIDLHPASRASYKNGEMMLMNNRWKRSGPAPNRYSPPPEGAI
ncbi:winged helix-turn-helix domain-containing protein [Gilvimarinus sp. F26214L]|uniref:winged helix-turn-helix domain-containing protein n=1 Tax=Gilvimarinus sp. DZF01 TaxID=3461371 RepID=UPI004045E7A1